MNDVPEGQTRCHSYFFIITNFLNKLILILLSERFCPPLSLGSADSRISPIIEPPRTTPLISHLPPGGSASLETLPQIDQPVILTKMKELKFFLGNVLPSLALLQPKPADCFIIRTDIDSSGNVLYTARGDNILHHLPCHLF